MMPSRTVWFVLKFMRSGLVVHAEEKLALSGFGELRSNFFALTQTETDVIPTRDAECRNAQIVAQVIILATRSCHDNWAIMWLCDQKTLHTLYAKRLIH